ncbi:hypothetical protein D3C75_928400 [compost metagenome]
MSKNKSVRLHGAIVAGICIALPVKQDIAPLPSGTGYTPADNVIDIRGELIEHFVEQRVLITKGVRLSDIEYCGSSRTASGSIGRHLKVKL